MLNRTAIVILLVVLVMAGIEPGPAEAHSRPIRFDPEPGAILAAPPSSIQGWFSSDLRRDPAKSFIHVLDGTKSRVDVGEPQLSSDRRSMSVALKSGLSAGLYTVHWSTFDDADGEVFSSCYTFFVGQEAFDKAVRDGSPMDGGDACPANAPSMPSMASVSINVQTSGRSATVLIQPTGFTPRAPAGDLRLPDFGHYHIYLDKAPIDVITGEAQHDHGATENHDHGAMETSSGSSAGLVENPVMWVENSYTFKNLSPGQHYIVVALFHDDHTPFSPPVLAEKSFEIGGASSGVPTWLLIAGVAAAIGLAAGKFVAQRPDSPK